MARRTGTAGSNIQTYPRIQDDDREADLLDDDALHPHAQRMSLDALKGLVRQAIVSANQKSSRAILNIPDGADQAEIEKIYQREGANLLKYFRKYCGDPAETARQVYRKSYRDVGVEQFRNRTLQKERMNSGWRYQFLATLMAQASGLPDRAIKYDETAIGDDVELTAMLQSLYADSGREDIVQTMLGVLMEDEGASVSISASYPPDAVLEAFGEACRSNGLVDDSGQFNDPYRLVEFFCGR